MKHRQQGITLLGFVMVLAVAGAFAYVGMKLFPMYSEYYSVKASLKGMTTDPELAQASPSQIRNAFFKRLYVNYSENVQEENVKVKRVDEGWQVDVDYEVRRDMVGNIDVVGRFDASQVIPTRGAVD